MSRTLPGLEGPAHGILMDDDDPNEWDHTLLKNAITKSNQAAFGLCGANADKGIVIHHPACATKRCRAPYPAAVAALLSPVAERGSNRHRANVERRATLATRSHRARITRVGNAVIAGCRAPVSSDERTGAV